MNKELAISQGLIVNDDNSVYKSLENKYKKIFEKYLLSKININQYDEKINNNNCYIGVGNPTPRQLISGLDNHLNSKYLFIVNHFFVEKLHTNDINYLRQCNEDDNNALLIVEKTYPEIIKDNFIDGNYSNEVFKINHGVAIPENFVDNNCLVFKLFYGKNTKQLEGKEFIDNLNNQNTFLNSIKEELKNEVKTKLNLPCEIIIEKIPN